MTKASATFSRLISSAARWPIVWRIRSRRTVTGLSAMICERERNPFVSLGSMCNPKIGRIRQFGSHLANDDRHMSFGKRICLNDNRRTRLSVIARRRDGYHVAALHASGVFSLKTETASIPLHQIFFACRDRGAQLHWRSAGARSANAHREAPCAIRAGPRHRAGRASSSFVEPEQPCRRFPE